VRELRAACRGLREEEAEQGAGLQACGELTERLAARMGCLEADVSQLRSALREKRGPVMAWHLGPEDVERLRHDVKVLEARLAAATDECGDEVRHLWLASDTELPRLRMAEAERRKLQSTLAQARWDRDRLQRDHSRVIAGLEEQRAAQELEERGLSAALESARTEGEEMAETLRETGRRLAEMRHDQWEAESFIQHLNGQLARLEKERDDLFASLRRRPLGAAGGERLAVLEHHEQARERVAAALRARLQECRAAEIQDEEEAEAVDRECGILEARIHASKERNAELRLEAATLAPLLQGRSPDPLALPAMMP